ncbi:MAG: type II toxin-antitoxin system RelE/ParE family toxin [Bilifractor sp.]|jgi:plasmid stabilization system protein ParE
MHEYKVIITNHALHSMKEIRDYIALELLNPSAAISHLELFRSEMKKLSDMPERHKLIDEQPWHDEGVRKVRVKTIIFTSGSQKKNLPFTLLM